MREATEPETFDDQTPGYPVVRRRRWPYLVMALFLLWVSASLLRRGHDNEASHRNSVLVEFSPAAASPSPSRVPVALPPPPAAPKPVPKPPPKVPVTPTVEVKGRVLLDDGTPARGVEVSVAPGNVDFISGFLFVFSNLFGDHCQNSDPPADCARGAATTGPDGRYSIRITGRLEALKAGKDLSVEAHRPPQQDEIDGPRSSRTFHINSSPQDVPEIRIWQSRVTVAGSGQSAQYGWKPLPADQTGPDLRYSLLFDVRKFESWSPYWSRSASTASITFDPRYLEDSKGRLMVTAGSGGSDDRHYASSRTAYNGPGAPPSRGAPCYAYSSSGQPVQQNPCRLTDGDFERDFFPDTESPCPNDPNPSCGEPRHESGFIDLGSVRQISLVVVRECASSTCKLETSTDAQSWAPLEGQRSMESYNLLVAASSPPYARYLRITDSFLLFVQELSVW